MFSFIILLNLLVKVSWFSINSEISNVEENKTSKERRKQGKEEEKETEELGSRKRGTKEIVNHLVAKLVRVDNKTIKQTTRKNKNKTIP